MTRAFVLERCNVDVSKASVFGNIVYVFDGNQRRSSIWSTNFITDVCSRLKDLEYDPANDYFVIVGPIVPLCKTIGHLVAQYGLIRALCWSASECSYTIQEIGNVSTIEDFTCNSDRVS